MMSSATCAFSKSWTLVFSQTRGISKLIRCSLPSMDMDVLMSP